MVKNPNLRWGMGKKARIFGGREAPNPNFGREWSKTRIFGGGWEKKPESSVGEKPKTRILLENGEKPGIVNIF